LSGAWCRRALQMRRLMRRPCRAAGAHLTTATRCAASSFRTSRPCTRRGPTSPIARRRSRSWRSRILRRWKMPQVRRRRLGSRPCASHLRPRRCCARGRSARRTSMLCASRAASSRRRMRASRGSRNSRAARQAAASHSRRTCCTRSWMMSWRWPTSACSS